jgi:hypothetical protein
VFSLKKEDIMKKTIKLSKNQWEDMGKKAGWLNEEGEVSENSEIEKTAQPVAPPKPKAPPQRTPTERPTRRRRRNPNPVINPKPKAKEVEEEPLAANNEEEVTIASELKRLLK